MNNYNIIYEHAADNYGLITSNEAKILGISNVELVKLAHRERIQRVGHGVYRIAHYVPTVNDKYAEAVALVGIGAIIFRESVLAMHNLALVNPTTINVAIPRRVRKKLPKYISLSHIEKPINEIMYEGIPSQSVFDAIVSCKNIIMTDRLIESAAEARKQGLISTKEAKLLKVILQ